MQNCFKSEYRVIFKMQKHDANNHGRAQTTLSKVSIASMSSFEDLSCAMCSISQNALLDGTKGFLLAGTHRC